MSCYCWATSANRIGELPGAIAGPERMSKPFTRALELSPMLHCGQGEAEASVFRQTMTSETAPNPANRCRAGPQLGRKRGFAKDGRERRR